MGVSAQILLALIVRDLEMAELVAAQSIQPKFGGMYGVVQRADVFAGNSIFCISHTRFDGYLILWCICILCTILIMCRLL